MGDIEEAAPAAAMEDSLDVAPAQRGAWGLDAGSAELAGWCILGLANQVLIALTSPPSEFAFRVEHHAFDFGHLVALGFLSYLGFGLFRLLFDRAPAALRRFRPLIGAGAFAAVVFGVGLLTMDQDVQNFANRQGLSQTLVILVASLAFSLLLTSTLLLRRFTGTRSRALLLFVGVGLGVLNGLVLESDYFATHLMAAWFAARLVGNALTGLRLRLPRRAAYGSIALLGAGAAASLITQPGNHVQLSLLRVPSSVVAPLWGRVLADQATLNLNLVPDRYRQSTWFKDRKQAASTPPSRALTPPRPAIVIFFTIDAFRADLLERDETIAQLPELSALRRESVYFTQARSPTPSTFTSGAAIFAVRHFSQLEWGRSDDGKKKLLADDGPRFTELLQRAGVRTVNVMGVTLGQLDAESGALRGFDVEMRPGKTKAPGNAVVSKIIKDRPDLPPESTLYYSHFIEPHLPYDRAGKHGSSFERYVREVALVDKEIGRLREHLRKSGLDQNTILIISADHGEGFGEHGTYAHALNVYEEAVHVPLIVHVPGVPAREISEPVSVMDVGPTLLDLFGVPIPGSYMGESLLPLIAGESKKLTRPVAVDSGRRLQAFYLEDGKKVIFDLNQRTTEVYDLKSDPGELQNLADSGAPGIAEAIETARLYFHTHAFRAPGYEQPWLKF
jgi:arylsulfatase A-like enzyme